jgi:hypothetical protein
LIDKVRKKKKNDVSDGLEGSDKGKNKEIRKCLGRGAERGDRELEKRGEGFRETNKFQADPFGFWFTFCFCP